MKKLEKELESFSNLWESGYFEGDCLNPFSISGYSKFGLGTMSVLFATYLKCIKPYINETTVALEIGPGRGAWTKALLNSKEVQVLDALSEKHNRFFEYLNYPQNVVYHHVKNFDCKMLPENHFNYMFSFGCLCHVSFEGISEYAKNIYSKLKAGSNCFWMIADFDHYIKACNFAQNERLQNINQIMFSGNRYINFFSRSICKFISKLFGRNIKDKFSLRNDVDNESRPGRWYNAGIKRTCTMLEKVGYKIIEADVGTCLRDPIIHFKKVS